MASVVAGLVVAVYGFGPSNDQANIFSSPAQAQVNTEVSKVAQPVGFADIVERVKPSVISVRVKIAERASASSEGGSPEASPVPPGSPMGRFFTRFAAPAGLTGP